MRSATLRRGVLAALTRTPIVSTWLVRRILTRRYVRVFKRAPDLRRPRRFTEYIVHRVLHDRDPLLRTASDKIAVRKWVDRVLGPGYTVRLLGAWSSAKEIGWAELPTPFVIKPSHSSGPFHIVYAPLSRSETSAIEAQVASWLDQDFFDVAFEWGYRGLPRRITAEPLLRAPDGGSLIEVDVFTFHGQPRVLLAFTGHKHSAKQRCALWLREDGTRSDIWGSTALAEDVLDAAGLQRMADQVEAVRLEMLDLSRRIGAHFPYVRVDFYITDAGLKIGELTTYPAAGRGIYHPEDADARLGQMLRLSGVERRARGLKPYPWPPLD